MKGQSGKDMVSKLKKPKQKFQSFQDTILNLQKFWSKHGCIILQPYDMEVGAGTFHPATTLRSIGPKHWKAAYVAIEINNLSFSRGVSFILKFPIFWYGIIC
mgnify:CR=1 FL=1